MISWLNVPFGILCIFVFLRFFDERVERHPHRVDYAGSLFLAGGIGTLMFVLVMLGSLSVPLTIALAAIAAILITPRSSSTNFHGRSNTMLPVRLYQIRVIRVAWAWAEASRPWRGALDGHHRVLARPSCKARWGSPTVLAGTTLGVTSAMWTVGS